MDKISNFLWKLFSVFVVFGWNTSAQSAASYGAKSGNPEKTYYTDYMPNIYSDEGKKRKLRICPEGTYVSKCNTSIVGWNWLKNVVLPMDDDDVENYYSTNNYLIYDDNAKKLDQMRAFFSGDTLSFQYCEGTDTSEGAQNCTSDIVSERPDPQDRDMILGYMCNPLKGTRFQCSPCPNNAWVNESVVYRSNSEERLIYNSWEFHTIADCYLTKFEDNTGTFIFTTEGTIEAETNGEKCYYNNTQDSVFLYGNDVSYIANAAEEAENTSYYTPNIPSGGSNYY